MDDAVLCEHKDCERTDSIPLEWTRLSPDGEVLGTGIYHFCPNHRDQLFALEQTPTLPPAEWYEDAESPGVS